MVKTPQKVDRATFIAGHPLCCYCAGRRPTTEIDHAPARIVFIKKHGPEGFLFPSCSECNRIAGLSEQVMAFYIRSFDRSARGLDEAEFEKLVSGLVNNAPEAVPRMPPRPSAGLALFTHGIYEADRTTTAPPAAKAHIELFGLKVLYALYYKITARFAGSSNRYNLNWAQTGTDAARQMLTTADKWIDEHKVGQRRNVDMGNQFSFQYGYHEAHGFFGVRMSFAGAFVMFGAIGPAREMAKLKNRDPLCPSIYVVGKMIKRQYHRKND
ncbi:HNH endonuclease [Sphingomonas sp. Leaf20]|uniref:HNH endonuclease n=1 Tax=Sphingomonas sp. Leaf20 TaxID=1735685 RepID=UPI0006F7B9FD|nr:HNH endonuclease [Sphingomonas sp. Leaf20]KQM73132.1 hypothetical protein ASE72_00135 [Sphingomonas sp. Leaf20]